MLVERVQVFAIAIFFKDIDQTVANAALDALVSAIKNATTSMTSVPKPIKYLKDYYGQLRNLHDGKQRALDYSNEVVFCVDLFFI